MQFETVGTVAMGDLASKSLRQVDNLDGSEWALLDAHAAANAEMLREEANLRGRLHVDAHLALAVEWARLGALLLALLRFALIRVDNGDPELVV